MNTLSEMTRYFRRAFGTSPDKTHELTGCAPRPLECGDRPPCGPSRHLEWAHWRIADAAEVWGKSLTGTNRAASPSRPNGRPELERLREQLAAD